MTTQHPTLKQLLQPRYTRITAMLLLSVLWVNSAPAKSALETTRSQMLRQFDVNKNGRLDSDEREDMRVAIREKKMKEGGGSGGLPQSLLDDYDTNKDGEMDEAEWADARIKEQEILTRQHDKNNDGKLSDEELQLMMVHVRTVPTRYARDYFAYLLAYDKNNSGGFDGDEYPQAQLAEVKYFTTTYDADGDGELSAEEKAELQSAMKRGKIVGFALRFAPAAMADGKENSRTARRRRGRGGDEYLEKSRWWLEFDKNGNGLADPEELDAIRESLSLAD